MALRPSPVPNADTETYWAMANEWRLTFQRCTSCGTVQFYPRAHCLACRNGTLTPEESCGLGTVHSFTVVQWAPTEALRVFVPYILALIDMREGFRIMANILRCPASEARIGMPVAVVFEETSNGQLIPQVEPDGRRR